MTEKFFVTGGYKLQGKVHVSGAKNTALKTLVAACLTDEEVIIENVPLISDFQAMIGIMNELGAHVSLRDHTVRIRLKKFTKHEIPLEMALKLHTSAMFIAPLLVRVGEAKIPNPGGCRLGARPINRTIEGLKKLNVSVVYNSEDGYFHAKTLGLKATSYSFEKNTHTGTETMIIAAVLASGKTILRNAAEEPEIDELIDLLNSMGANIVRSAKREITIEGVKKLHGTRFKIKPDRNEIVTFAIAAILTQGDIFVVGATESALFIFLAKLTEANGGYEIKKDGIRFFSRGKLKTMDVKTSVYPGFMTDWQAPWSVLMTKAQGISHIHETVFENKLDYTNDLEKMGAKIEPYKPQVENPDMEYNFNLADDKPEYIHAIRIKGPSALHNAIVTTFNIRAGAAIVLAALAAKGTSIIYGIEKLDRGYEKFEERLRSLGAHIKRVREK